MTTMNTKQAFKLGFVMKLAEEGIKVSDFVEACAILTEKEAAKDKKDKKKDDKDKPRGSDGGGRGGMLQAGLLGSLGAVGGSFALPNMVGTQLGATLANSMAAEDMSTDDLRRVYLIRKLRQMADHHRTRINNRLLSRVISE